MDYYKSVNKKYKYLLICCIVVFLLFIFGTSPYDLPLLFVPVPMIPAVIIIVLLARWGLRVAHVNDTLAYRLTVIVGLVVSVAAVLLSLGQFTFKDFFLLFLFGLVGTFYISRMFR